MCCGCQQRQSNVATIPFGASSHDNSGMEDPTVMVYYFHRTTRCPTCLSIEANVAQIIKDNFHQQLADDRLMWRPFNMDDPGGDEFRKKFDLTTSTLVVAKKVDVNRVEFEKLDKVWQLLGNPDGFSEYVTGKIAKFLNDR
jgi:hypothetical protein